MESNNKDNKDKGADLTFRTYQYRTSETAIYNASIDKLMDDYWYGYDQRATVASGESITITQLLRLAYVGLGLGESGEIQGKIKKIIRDSGGVMSSETKKSIGKELGDLLWYVSECCNVMNFDLGEVAQGNLDKLSGRKDRGVLGGSGDER